MVWGWLRATFENQLELPTGYYEPQQQGGGLFLQANNNIEPNVAQVPRPLPPVPQQRRPPIPTLPRPPARPLPPIPRSHLEPVRPVAPMFAQHPVNPYNPARQLPPPGGRPVRPDRRAYGRSGLRAFASGRRPTGWRRRRKSRSKKNDAEQNANVARNQLMNYFADPKKTPGFEFRRFLGQGGYGVAALVADVRDQELPPRLMVVKRAFPGKGTEKSMRTEISWLQILAWRSRYTTSFVWEIGDLFRSRARYLNGLPGPTIVTEYVENGTFENFFDKTCESPEPVPNRILWSILLCGIRACIGMMWPIRAPHKAPTEIEIIDPSRPPLMLQHSDIHMNNVIFGELQHGSEEHDLVPAYKLIDFGVARDVDEDLFPPGKFHNIIPLLPPPFPSSVPSLLMIRLFPTNQIVMALIAKEYNWWSRWGAFMDGYIETDAYDLYMPGAELRYPTLDPDLRQLIGRMMAKEEPHRIPIRDCLALATAAVRDKTADDYPANRAAKTDDAILGYIQRAFHDARLGPSPDLPPGIAPDARRPPKPPEPPQLPQLQPMEDLIMGNNSDVVGMEQENPGADDLWNYLVNDVMGNNPGNDVTMGENPGDDEFLSQNPVF
ncbi:hypothetical protein PG993_011985 [Apiospora rasikravindrae]|uniref:Protein kinase domain-containing protein n=1 Tax=Apiospora rasikravindrae TaxID=990691 RepID=A0ABR1S167_9PEZI